MKNLSYQQVNITGGFWKNRQEINRKITIESVWKRFSDTGRIQALHCQWKEGMPNQPHIFWDSDVAKWVEGAACSLFHHSDEDLKVRIESIIDQLEAHQWEDGYLNSYYTTCEPENRFTDRNNHELYCAGHWIEAAVSYDQATGDSRFLKIIERYVALIDRIFRREDAAAFVTPGHEEIELALIRLYRHTGERKYLELAAFFINQRGCNFKDEVILTNKRYAQDQAPVREQHTAEGHAVRACYLYAAMADLAAETRDEQLLEVCRKLFWDITQKKMYITGGIGSSYLGEAFTVPFDLPNETAYAETCAAIAMIFFCQRMLEITGEAVYGDAVERELYNGMLAGVSLDGTAFFYENPLEINLKNRNKNVASDQEERLPITQRMQVFECSCCPPNINRLMASLGGYIYGQQEGTVFVHQFVDSMCQDGEMEIRQTTRYPAEGTVELTVKGVHTLMIRIPGWCAHFTLDTAYTLEKGYAKIENPSEKISINFEMAPLWMTSDPRVRANAGKIALQRGPVVYCVESETGQEDIYHVLADPEASIREEWDEMVQTVALRTRGWRIMGGDSLYTPVGRGDQKLSPVSLRMIPYFAFANRGERDMLVWIPQWRR